MNKSLYLLFILSISITGCKSTTTTTTISVAKTVANEVVVINEAVKSNSFGFLDKSFEGKDIIILGEVDHGDGKTFEIKAELVKYLVEQKGYNTFAFEARDFFEMEYINGRASLEGVLDKKLKDKGWVRQWSPWGAAKEIQTLVDVLTANKLNYVGIETYSYTSVNPAIKYLKDRLDALGINSLDKDTWYKLQDIHFQMNETYNSVAAPEQVEYYIKNIEQLMQGINHGKGDEFSFIYQVADNAVTAAKMNRFNTPGLADEAFNEKIMLRDAQMARNLVWFKKRNPDAKIIVWMANFHGANNLGDVQYNGDDPTRYSKFTVFGDHIAKEYGNKVYSLAFTSSRGNSKMPYDYYTVEEVTINAPEGSLEYYLDTKNIDYGFIDFERIRRKKPGLSEKQFNSIMLGFISQQGKWLNVFDGVFYIRENHNATPLK